MTANFPYVDVLFQSSRSLRTATRPEISLRPSALHFNPRGPCGPRRTADQLAAWCFEFQSSRSLRTATWVGTVITSITGISILAVLADRDPSFPGFPSRICISILAVLADRDVHDMDVTADGELFQSSRSLRTATCGYYRLLGEFAISILAVLADRDVKKRAKKGNNMNFNPRGPCGPRLYTFTPAATKSSISILAVLADRDWPCSCNGRGSFEISILAVLADRDARTFCAILSFVISILAVLADRDSPPAFSKVNPSYFNPRGPCGPRLDVAAYCYYSDVFQSSRSLRTATRGRWRR